MLQEQLAEMGFHNAINDTTALQMARRRFEEMQRAGQLRRMWSGLRRRARGLLALADYQQGCALVEQHYLGTCAVPLEQIVGSENRTTDFDTAFYPIGEHMASKWVSVAQAFLRGVRLPPVQLVKVGDIYFVRDGHNRISVARAFGQASIDAVITEWHASRAC